MSYFHEPTPLGTERAILPFPQPARASRPRTHFPDLPWSLPPALYLAALALEDSGGGRALSTPDLLVQIARLPRDPHWPLPTLARLRLLLGQHARTHGAQALILRASAADHWHLCPDGSTWLALARQHLAASPHPYVPQAPVAARMVRLLYALIAAAPSGGLTTRELATWLGKGPRQTQRDLLALADMGFPIAEEEEDRVPRYAIHEAGWSLLPTLAGPDEQAALYLLLRTTLKQWGHLAPLRALCLSLAPSLPPGLQAPLVAGYEPPDSGSARLLAQALAQVVAAWQGGVQLLVDGVAHDIVAVEPMGGAVWVIHHPAGGQLTTTPLTDWLEATLRLTQTPISLALNGTLLDWVGEQVGEVVDLTSAYQDVTLLVGGAARQAFLPPRPPFHPSQMVQPLPDGRLHVTLTVPGVEGLLPPLLAWGLDVEVLAPTSLRARLLDHHATLVRRYAMPLSASHCSELQSLVPARAG